MDRVATTTSFAASLCARGPRCRVRDHATPAWTQLHLSAAYALRLAQADGLAFVKLNNLGNRLAYNASTIATLRPLSPLPGRALLAGLRLSF